MNARQAKEIFIANFNFLPDSVKQSVEFTLSNWHELKIFHVAQDKDGYEIVNLSSNGISRNVGVHVLVAEAFIANPDKKSQVNHFSGVYIRKVYIKRHPEFGACALAKKFNVSRKIIENVVKRKTYKNI